MFKVFRIPSSSRRCISLRLNCNRHRHSSLLSPATRAVTGDSEKFRSRLLADKSVLKHGKLTMKMCLAVALVGLTIGFALPSIAQEPKTVDPGGASAD